MGNKIVYVVFDEDNGSIYRIYADKENALNYAWEEFLFKMERWKKEGWKEEDFKECFLPSDETKTLRELFDECMGDTGSVHVIEWRLDD